MRTPGGHRNLLHIYQEEEIMKKNPIIICSSFVTAVLLTAVIFVSAGFYPGSENSLLIFDMREQFVSFYSSLKSLFSGGAFFLYSFQGSLGTPYPGLYAYYLASPFSFITLFFDTSHLPEAVLLMDVLKAGCISAAFSAYALHKGLKSAGVVIPVSLCYALSSASVSFFILPMYLDTFIFLPLICLFLERMIVSADRRTSVRNGICYAVLLGLSICIHYYSAAMVCMFLVLFSFRAVSGLNVRKALGKYFSFMLYSVIGALLSVPVIMPVLRELMNGKMHDAGIYSDGSVIVTGTHDLLKQFTCGHFGGMISEGAPEIYCTLIMTACGLLGIITDLAGKESKNRIKTNKEISAENSCEYGDPEMQEEIIPCRKRGIISVIILAVFICSFILRPMYRIWHMFRDPVAYPHRFAFIFVFFILVLAAETFRFARVSAEENSKASRMFIFICSVSVPVLLVINGVKILKAEIFTLPHMTSSDYRIMVDSTADALSLIEEDAGKVYDGRASLCRISKDYDITSNDPMLLGYNGMDLFSSSYDSDALNLYKNLGFLQYHYKSCDAGMTVLTDMLLGFDYLISADRIPAGYEYIDANGYFAVSRNPYSLGIGYMAGEDRTFFSSDPFANQKSLLDSITGKDTDILHEIAFNEECTDYYGLGPGASEDGSQEYSIIPMIRRNLTFTAPAGESIYINFDLLRESELDYEEKSNPCTLIISLDDRVCGAFSGYQNACNTYLGCFDEDTEITLTIEGAYEYREAYIYGLDMEGLKVVYEDLYPGTLVASEISPVHIRGTVTVSDNSAGTASDTITVTDTNTVSDTDTISDKKTGSHTLLFTIIYSDRFMVYVDGRRAETAPYAGALLSVPGLEPGEHEIEVIYK